MNDENQLSIVEDPTTEQNQRLSAEIDQRAVEILPEFRENLQAILVAHALFIAVIVALEAENNVHLTVVQSPLTKL